MYDTAALRGVPAHVTVLYPWLPREVVTADDLAALGEIATAATPAVVRLARLERFPAVLWLAPDPCDLFDALTAAVVARWPQCPPYAGTVAEPVAHLTVAQGPDDLLDEVAARVEPRLPVGADAERLVLIGNDGERWSHTASWSLGG